MVERFKLDENIPADVAAHLRSIGHDAETVLEEDLGGAVDENLIEVSRSESRILVTLDLDFADIRLYPPASNEGVWVLRPRSQSIRNILALVIGAISLLEVEEVQHRLWIIEPGRVRIHE